MERPADHPVIPPAKVGLLLVNLGTPGAPDVPSVKRYLAEFLSDRRVVEIPSILWQPILRSIVLTTRPKKSAEAYKQVWTEEGSPLMVLTRAQADGLAARLGDGVMVRYAMRYGNPGIVPTLDAMIADGATRILVAPLYPQYSAATNATVFDMVAARMAERRNQQLQQAQSQFDSYVRNVSSESQPAEQIARGKQLLDSGAITKDEFESLKARVLT